MKQSEKQCAGFYTFLRWQLNRLGYDFDWEEFNRQGEEFTARIADKLMPGYSIYYEPSDDREFFQARRL